jgi:hypothetical protein
VSRCSANPSAAAARITFARMSRDQYDEPVGRPVDSGLTGAWLIIGALSKGVPIKGDYVLCMDLSFQMSDSGRF